jgi:hypothetical protein
MKKRFFILFAILLGANVLWAQGVIVVTSIAPTGPGSFRQALTDVPTNGVIRFADELADKTIALSAYISAITGKSFTIEGNGVTVSGEDIPVITTASGKMIAFSNSNVTIKKVHFTCATTTNSAGGAIHTTGGTLRLDSCSFSKNKVNVNTATGTYGGAAIYNNGTLELNACIFSENQVTGGNNGTVSAGGGAIFHYAGTLKVNSCLFSENQITGSGLRTNIGGGAIYHSGTLELNACIFNSNKMAGTFNANNNIGGAIYSEAPCTINACTFYNNSSGNYGGAIYNNKESLTLTGNLFYKNLAGSSNSHIIYRIAGTVTSNGYNVYDNTSNNTPFSVLNDVDITGVTSPILSPITFRPIANSDNANQDAVGVIPAETVLENYPAHDFYGQSLDFSNSVNAGAVQGIASGNGNNLHYFANNGSVTVPPDMVDPDGYTIAESITLTATANPDYAFVNWMVNGVLDSEPSTTLTLTMDGDKTVEAVFRRHIFRVINTNNTNTYGSLRKAITESIDGDTIIVDADLANQTITASTSTGTGTFNIAKNITIEGNGIIISSAGTVQIMNITVGYNVTISRVRFYNGLSKIGSGLAVSNFGTLTLQSCIFNNTRRSEGTNYGTIYNNGTLTVNGCTFYYNNVTYGGAIYNTAIGTLHLTGNLFSKNTAGTPITTYGQVIHNLSGGSVISHDYNVYDNTSYGYTFDGPNDKNIISTPTPTVISAQTFCLVANSAAAEVITTRPADYPTVDFYGDPIPATNAAAGAVQSFRKFIWKGSSSSSNWNLAANWNETAVPSVSDDVYIPASVTRFLILEGNYSCNDIYFEAGAELGRQDLLTCNKAYVDYKLDPAHRFYMLSIPVNDIKASDFYLGGNPPVYLKEYYLTSEGGAAWRNITEFNKSLPLGSGFAYRVGGNKETTVRISGTLTKNDVPETLNFGSDSRYPDSYFALAANPFMTSIDFSKLENSSITANYLIWNEGKVHVGYTPLGTWGGITEINNTDYGKIAPLQSFFVEKSSEATDGQLTFNLNIAATGTGTLRSETAPSDKLSIIATNSADSVLTFIATREYGQSTVSSSDARKMFSTANSSPDIYTLKASGNGQVALGANIINTDNMLIPLGLSTTYSGNIRFTFYGMDTYNALITFIDQVENKQMDISGLSSYEYSFDYAPSPANEQAVTEGNRFFIQLAPTDPTGGLDKATTGTQATVYSKGGTIYAATAASDPIRQMWVYNTQGTLIYADRQVNTSFCSIPSGVTLPEICIVKLITEKGVKNVKLINR